MLSALVLAPPPWSAALTWLVRPQDPPILVLLALCLIAAGLGPLSRRPSTRSGDGARSA